MLNKFIVRTKDGTLSSFYHCADYSIKYMEYNGTRLGGEKTLISDVRESFTVNISNNGDLYLFCQDRDGNVILCTKTKIGWKTKAIIPNTSGNAHSVQLNAIINDNALNLIYNSPSQSLVMQRMDNSAWENPEKIDDFLNLPHSIFSFQNTSAGHALLFYLTHENHCAYREINSEKFGSINVFHSGGQITDYSFLTANDTVHLLYAVKGIFSSQLVYRKKASHRFGNIVVLWEAQRFDNCLIFTINNTIHITYSVGDHLYMITSNDNGSTFSRPSRYKDRFASNICKATYVSDDYNQGVFSCNEIYIDKSDVGSILLLPSLCDSFYPVATEIQPETNVAVQVNAELQEKMEKLQNKYDALSSQLKQKDNQIINLSTLLKNRSEDISITNSNWKARYKSLQDENQLLKKELAAKYIPDPQAKEDADDI